MIDKLKDIDKFKIKNGDIYMLIFFRWSLKSGVLFVLVIFVVDLKLMILDVLEMIDLDMVRNCNDVWVIDYVLK